MVRQFIHKIYYIGFVFSFIIAVPTFATALDKVHLTFCFPVAVSGPITKIIEDMTADFMRTHPDIVVKPIYTGTYKDTITKVLTAMHGGEPPHVAVLLACDIYSLIDENAIIAYEDLPGGKELSHDYFPVFMKNSQAQGKTWGIPFQRSTIVMFWNKEAFIKAGLNPTAPPQTWQELIDISKKLVERDSSGKVTQWGISIPTTGYAYWMFQALCIQNGLELANPEGTKVYFNDPRAVEALQFLVDLSYKHGVMAKGTIEWSTIPRDFLEGKTAMMWTTTGNLTNIQENTTFDYGVSILPKHIRFGSPTGGGNFYILKKTTEAERDAALKFVKWMTDKERAAQWSIDTGYVLVRPDACQTENMKRYIKEFPYLDVALEQLKYGVAELSTHANQRVTKVLEDAIQSAVTGTKTPSLALEEAQKDAERILLRYSN